MYDPELHHRQSIRLRDYDYSKEGMYFVTICAKNHECVFGSIVGGAMQKNDVGHAVERYWNEIPQHFPHVGLDVYVIMPNHLHGIVIVGANNHSPSLPPVLKRPPRPATSGTSKTLGSIVRGFKIAVTKWMRSNTAIPDVWQRNYLEHVVRDESELERIREYIQNNPAQWEMDRLNPMFSVDGK
jgi:REP element-mobilizing transposase RayT